MTLRADKQNPPAGHCSIYAPCYMHRTVFPQRSRADAPRFLPYLDVVVLWSACTRLRWSESLRISSGLGSVGDRTPASGVCALLWTGDTSAKAIRLPEPISSLSVACLLGPDGACTGGGFCSTASLGTERTLATSARASLQSLDCAVGWTGEEPRILGSTIATVNPVTAATTSTQIQNRPRWRARPFIVNSCRKGFRRSPSRRPGTG
jgi:hypothetical protein